MRRPVSLSVHRNTVADRRDRINAGSVSRAVEKMIRDQHIKAFAVVGIDEDGTAFSLWDTGGVVPMWAFPGMVHRVLDFDLAASGADDDFRAPFLRERFKRGKSE